MIKEMQKSVNPTTVGAVLGVGAAFVATASQAAVILDNTPESLRLTGTGTAAQSRSLTLGSTGVTLTNFAQGRDKSYVSSATLESASGFVTGNVGQGTVIGAHLAGTSGTSTDLISLSAADKNANPGSSSGSGLFGFSFVNAGTTNYGWANLSYTYDGNERRNSLVATVNAFAFENTGLNIVAGLPTATTSVPEADSLAMLVAGAGLIGLTVHRRRKSTPAKSEASFALAA